MAGISTFRCPDCHEVLLISDRGRVRVVRPAESLGTDRKGDPEVRCICGTVAVWQKEPARVT